MILQGRNHRIPPQFVINYEYLGTTTNGIFNRTTVRNLATNNEETKYSFKSEQSLLSQVQRAMIIDFVIMESGKFKNESFIAFVPTRYFRYDENDGSFYMTEESHKIFENYRILEWGHSCSPTSLSITHANEFVHFKSGNHYYIPFWGFNDQGTVRPTHGHSLFTFNYRCNQQDFNTFQTKVSNGIVRHATPGKFDDYPSRIDPVLNHWIHQKFEIVS